MPRRTGSAKAIERCAVVDRLASAMRDGNLDTALSCLTEDVHYIALGGQVTDTTGDYSGHEGFVEWWRRESSRGFVIEDWDLELLPDGRIFAELRVGVPADGGWLAATRAIICILERGRISSIEVFRDSERAYERATTPLR